MQEIFSNLFPNVAEKFPAFWESIGQTLEMVIRSGVIGLIIGAVLGVVLVVTKKGGIFQNTVVFQIVDKLVNLFRAIPFIILLTFVMPLSRAIMGTAIGVDGAIVPLIFGMVPFFSRQMESALSEVSPGRMDGHSRRV